MGFVQEDCKNLFHVSVYTLVFSNAEASRFRLYKQIVRVFLNIIREVMQTKIKYIWTLKVSTVHVQWTHSNAMKHL
jgi:hypothetical protein